MLEKYKDFFMAMLAILGIFIPPLVSIITEKIKNPQISYRVPIILLISVCSLLCFVAFYIFFTDIIEMLFEKISKFILTANNLFGLPPNLTNFFMQLFIASSIFMFGAQIFSERLHNRRFLFTFVTGFICNLAFIIVWTLWYTCIQNPGTPFFVGTFPNTISCILNCAAALSYLPAWFSFVVSGFVFLLGEQLPIKKIIISNCISNFLFSFFFFALTNSSN